MNGGGYFKTNGLNEACKNTAASYLKVGDEYMSAISFGRW